MIRSFPENASSENSVSEFRPSPVSDRAGGDTDLHISFSPFEKISVGTGSFIPYHCAVQVRLAVGGYFGL
jgi:hypothetical protein